MLSLERAVSACVVDGVEVGLDAVGEHGCYFHQFAQVWLVFWRHDLDGDADAVCAMR